MSGIVIRDFSGATSVHMHNGLAYDEDGALLVSQGYCVGQNFTGWTRTAAGDANDTSFQELAAITVPGGLMGLHSAIEITLDWSYTNAAATTKNLSFFWNGVEVIRSSATSLGGAKNFYAVANQGSTSSQTISNSHTYGNAARTTGSADTTSDVVISIRCSWSAASATDTITLLGYKIWHFPAS